MEAWARLSLAAGVDAIVAAAGGRMSPGQLDPRPLPTRRIAPADSPAQRRAVDRHCGFSAAIGARRGLQAVSLDVVAAGDDVEVLRVELWR